MTLRDDRVNMTPAHPGSGPVGRALVCLDDPQGSGALAAALRKLGMAVVVSPSPADARDALAFGTPDVLVAELVAGCDDVAGELLRDAATAGTLTLAVVPSSALGSAPAGLWSLGAREVFHQPIDIDALAARIGAELDSDDDTAGPQTRVAAGVPVHEPDTVFSAAPAFDPKTLRGHGAGELPFRMAGRSEGPRTEVGPPPQMPGPADDNATMDAGSTERQDDAPRHEAPGPLQAPPGMDLPVDEAPDALPERRDASEAETALEQPSPATDLDSMVDELMAGFDFGEVPLPAAMTMSGAHDGRSTDHRAAATEPSAWTPEPSAFMASADLDNPWDRFEGTEADIAGEMSELDAMLATAGVSAPLVDPAVIDTTESAPVVSATAGRTRSPTPSNRALAGSGPQQADREEPRREDLDGVMDLDAAGEQPECTEHARPGTADPSGKRPNSAESDLSEGNGTDLDAADVGAADPGAADLGATDPDATDPDATDPDATDPDATDPGEQAWDGPSTGEMLLATMPAWRRHKWVGKAAVAALAAVVLGQLGYLGYQLIAAPAGTDPAQGLVDASAEAVAPTASDDEQPVRPSDVPTVPSVESEARRAYGEGVLAAQEGDLDKAARHYRHLLRKPVDHAGGMAGLCAVLIEQGHFAEARTLLSELAVAEPTDALVQLDLGLVANELDDKEGARQALKRYLELAPPDHEHREDVTRLVLALDGEAKGT